MNEHRENSDVMECLFKLMRLVRRHPVRGGTHSHGGNRLMRVLAENGPAGARELAERLDIRPSSLSELLGRLEGRGLIARDRDETDSRVVMVSLTEEGRAEYERSAEAVRAARAAFASCLDDEERGAFCAIARKLSEHLESLPQDESERGCDGHDRDSRHGRGTCSHGGCQRGEADAERRRT